MWSDSTPQERLRALATGLRSVLPSPSPKASSIRRTLHGRATVEQVAEALRAEPGFAWLNGGSRGPYLLHRPLAVVAYWGSYAVVSGPGGTARLSGSGFDILQAMLDAWGGPAGAILAGFLSYDLAAEIENLGTLPPEDFRFPKFNFGLFDSAMTFEDERWNVIETDAWRVPPNSPDDLLRRAENIIPQIASRPSSVGALHSRPDRQSFEAAVDRIVATIHAGDIFQTNLCRRIESCLEHGMEWDLYHRMRAISPSQYGAFLRIDDQRAILSISPELFLKVDAGIVQSSPIKGTRARGCTADQDQGLLRQLLTSEKDRAELAMIVDVVRNDLGRVCETGTVKVTQHAQLMTLPTVHHLFSTVSGRLGEGRGTVELLRAAFPPASITGAPKIEAMRVAMREEGQLRGPCMGAIGWISMDHQMELSVAIRTAFVADRRVRYYAGCGITSDSVPHNEFLESRHKAAAFVRALGREEDRNW